MGAVLVDIVEDGYRKPVLADGARRGEFHTRMLESVLKPLTIMFFASLGRKAKGKLHFFNVQSTTSVKADFSVFLHPLNLNTVLFNMEWPIETYPLYPPLRQELDLLGCI